MGSESYPGPLLARGGGLVVDNNRFVHNDWTAVTTYACFPKDYETGTSHEPGTTLRNKNMDCENSGKYTMSFGGSKALTLPAGSPSHPTLVRRNTVANFGPSEGINPAKNTLVILNDVGGVTDIQVRVFLSLALMSVLCSPGVAAEQMVLCLFCAA